MVWLKNCTAFAEGWKARRNSGALDREQKTEDFEEDEE